MMRDKVGIQEKMSFVLNGKPITPGETETTLPPPPVTSARQYICPKCGVDRLQQPCPLSDNLPRMLQECPTIATAQ